MTDPEIFYEDKDIIAVSKPAGILVHPDGRSHEETLADWFAKKFPRSKNVGEPFEIDSERAERPGIVHRLDKDTSGVILLAKTKAGFTTLKEQFQNHDIKKIYHAIVVGLPHPPRGIIDRPIGTSSTDFRERSAARSAKGELREAQTGYLVKATVKVKGETFSLVQAMPKTGRTHQIRVHMKAIGHPIVADELYGHAKNPLGLKRMALHARSIDFANVKGEMIHVEAPYPEDFEKAVEKFK